jgi:hypothetical protein
MQPVNKKKMTGQSSAIYGLAFIGALIYFLQHATSFWDGAVGVLKAIVWPGVLVYKLLEFLKA